MKSDKRVKKTIIFIPIFIIFCIVGLKFTTSTNKNKIIEDIKNTELYIMSKGGDGTYTDGLERYGFMDEKGQIVIEPKYKEVTEFFEGVAYVKDTNDNGYLIDKNENKISNVKGTVIDVYDGVWLIKLNNKWGCIDKTGNWVVEPKFEGIYSFTEGLAAVNSNGKWGYVDKKGKWIIEPTFQKVDSFTEGLAAARLNNKWGYIDKTGNWVVEPKFTEVYSFTEGLAAVRLNENWKWGYINKNGEWIIKPIFHKTSRFKNGYAIVGIYDVNHDFKEGVINKKGKFVIEPKYDEVYLDALDKGGFVFNQNGLYGVLSFTGEESIKPTYTYFYWKSDNKIFMDKDTIYFLDERLNIKNKHKLGKVFFMNYDNKFISIMTKDGACYFNKDGQLIKKIDDDFTKAFEKVNGIN